MKAKERIKELRRRARLQELVVLVWGPGDPGPTGSTEIRKYWEKRKQIRKAVSSKYPNAEVLFSESTALRDYTRDLNDLLAEELVHATIADCILVLDLSRGAHVEVDRFSLLPEIAAKMTVLLPDRYVGSTGLVSHVHRSIYVLGFSDDELDRCYVATKKSLSVVDSFAIQKLVGASLTRYL
jgi:hypothetical protein